MPTRLIKLNDLSPGVPLKVQGWLRAQLPNDSFSIENAIIMEKSKVSGCASHSDTINQPLCGLVDLVLAAHPSFSFVSLCYLRDVFQHFPLCIDPQGQANKWIKNLEKARQLKIIKLTDQQFARTVENCVQFGAPLLIEGVGDTLDPLLVSTLARLLLR